MINVKRVLECDSYFSKQYFYFTFSESSSNIMSFNFSINSSKVQFYLLHI